MSKLLFMVLANFLITGGVYLLEQRTAFGRMKYWQKQIIIGLSFGLLAMLATRYGISTHGAIVNVRDAMPMTAGLLFGGPAGILAGLIGGLHRWFYPLWGTGSYTRLACSVATVIAGLAAALMRKFFFRNRCPALYYVGVFSLGVEAFHMLTIFLTHMDDLIVAFQVIRQTTVAMISGNTIALLAAVILYQLLQGGEDKASQQRPNVSPAVPKALVHGLLFCITLAFVSVGLFTYFLQTRLSEISLEESLSASLTDVENLIQRREYGTLEENGRELLSNMQTYHIHLYSAGRIFVVDSSGEAYIPGERLKEGIPFPLDPVNPGTLHRSEFQNRAIYYVQKPVSDYHLVAAIFVSDTMLFRNITMYLLTFMIIMLFTSLFFGCYIFVRKNIISNISLVTTAMGHLLNAEEPQPPSAPEKERFVSMSGEINQSLWMLRYYCQGVIDSAETREGDIHKFRYQAEHDGLTGLLNRVGLEQQLPIVEQIAPCFAFLYIDVDYFKQINDAHGHDVGDQILQKIAQVIRDNIRSADVPVRLGGDEFALLMVGCTDRYQQRIQEKFDAINAQLQAPEDGLPPVSLSVGVAFTEDGYSEELTQRADQALYRAKAAGRGCCRFYADVADAE